MQPRPSLAKCRYGSFPRADIAVTWHHHERTLRFQAGQSYNWLLPRKQHSTALTWWCTPEPKCCISILSTSGLKAASRNPNKNHPSSFGKLAPRRLRKELHTCVIRPEIGFWGTQFHTQPKDIPPFSNTAGDWPLYLTLSLTISHNIFRRTAAPSWHMCITESTSW